MADRFDKFTDDARRVLTNAQEEARRLNHNHIDTEHFLLGLLLFPDCVGAAVLRRFDVDFDRCRDSVLFIIGRGVRPPRGGIGFTRGAKKVIELAVDEAHLMRHNYIGTEHLLLGLVSEGSGIAAGVLLNHYCTLDAVRQATVHELDARANVERTMGHGAGGFRLVRNPARLEAAQKAIDVALDDLASAPFSRMEHDLVNLLLVPHLRLLQETLDFKGRNPSDLDAPRNRVNGSLELLGDVAQMFPKHGLQHSAEVLDAVWIAGKAALMLD